MKRIIIISLSILVVLSIMTVSIFALTGLNSNPESEPEAEIEENTEEIVIDDGVFSMSELNFSKNSYATVEDLFTAASNSFDSIIAKNDTIEFDTKNFVVPNSYRGDFPMHIIDVLESGLDAECKASTKENTDSLKYFMLLYTLISEYPDNVTDVKGNLRVSCNSYQPEYLFVSFDDFKEMGYDTIEDYILAIRTNKVKPGENSYLISYSRFIDPMAIYKFPAENVKEEGYLVLYNITAPNLVDEFLSKNDNAVE